MFRTRDGGGAPDLELGIRLDRSGRRPVLHFELHAQHSALGLHHQPFGARTLESDPGRFLGEVFSQLGDLLPAERPGALEDVGSYLTQQLVPDELLGCLAGLLEPVRSLQIHSEEPWIPWELVRLEAGHARPEGGGAFLCEAFDLSRWLAAEAPRPQPLTFTLERTALVVPRDSRLDVGAEVEAVESLARDGRQVVRLAAQPPEVRRAFASGSYDVIHFSGHADAATLADRAQIELEEGTRFTPLNLRGEARRLGERRPLVFLNGCHTGRAGFALTGLGGWAEHCLAVGAGAFVGTWWAVRNSRAAAFADAFYGGLISGEPIARSFRLARQAIRHADDPTWLAYSLYAHPLARFVAEPAAARPVFVSQFRGEGDADGLLGLPEREYRPGISPPGALLRADHGVVPFHGRERELQEIYDWCRTDAPVQVRLYTGAGGMGKTRLALEIARYLQEESWRSGFIDVGEIRVAPGQIWQSLTRSGRPLFLVVDYAESRRDLLVGLLGSMQGHRGAPVRLLLLARSDVDWWFRLKSEGDGVGDLLQGPATQVHSLGPLALSVEDRRASYRLAAESFARILDRAVPENPPDLRQPWFDRALLLHMAALVQLEDGVLAGRSSLLDHVLSRERRYWERRAGDWKLPATIVPGLGRALAAITLAQGAPSESAAVDALRGLSFFAERERDVLVAVVRLLHECYPGTSWIEPLQPDLLGEHLFWRELEAGADDLVPIAMALEPPPSGE